jgi:serine/threonine protein kinase
MRGVKFPFGFSVIPAVHQKSPLSTAIGHLHQRGLIHKDIKPANVLVHSVTGQCWLMGFGIASRILRERQAPEPPKSIAGTLPYMAPEQTGRMNRSLRYSRIPYVQWNACSSTCYAWVLGNTFRGIVHIIGTPALA